MKKPFVAILAAGLTLMAGCSSEPTNSTPAEKPQPKPPEQITGSAAFYKCYISARGWAADAQPYRVQSEPTTDSKGRDGKAAEWRASFASPSLHTTRPYTWALGDVSHSVQFLKTDTDKAFALAQEHGGEKLLQKEPDTPVLYVLEWDRQTNELLWHVIYGPDRDTAKLRIAINASTGLFSRVEK
jgi:hypothetical protein